MGGLPSLDTKVWTVVNRGPGFNLGGCGGRVEPTGPPVTTKTDGFTRPYRSKATKFLVIQQQDEAISLLCGCGGAEDTDSGTVTAVAWPPQYGGSFVSIASLPTHHLIPDSQKDNLGTMTMSNTSVAGRHGNNSFFR